MCLIVTFIVCSIVFEYGSAEEKCSVPVNTSVIYFDLEQLSLLSLQQNFKDGIQSPVLCWKGDDEECSTQQCCEGEVGCCYNDQDNNHIRKCGSRKPADKLCMYRAPLAVLSSPGSYDKGKHSACLRENRGKEENYILTGNTALTPEKAIKRNSRQIAVQGIDTILEIIATAAESNMVLPVSMALIYLDLEQLSSIAVQQGFRNDIQSPKLCEKGTDSECNKQQCCQGEVGCCFADLNDDARKCGCKSPKDETCKFRAPLAILTNSECNANGDKIAGACLTEKRENEEKYIMTGNLTKQLPVELEKKSLLSDLITFYRVRFSLLCAVANC